MSFTPASCSQMDEIELKPTKEGCQEVAFRFLGFIIFIHGIWLKREMRDNIKLYFSGILDIQVSTEKSLK